MTTCFDFVFSCGKARRETNIVIRISIIQSVTDRRFCNCISLDLRLSVQVNK